MKQTDDLETFMIAYLLERGADINNDNVRDYDFVSAGVIDSFETLAFLLVLEQEFGVKIPPEDFVDQQFHVVGKLIDFIDEHRA